jgi:RND superfamily putative drug exporter
MEALARFVMKHRRLIVGIWVVLTLFGAFAAGQVSKRWLEQFSIPGYSAYEANQRTLKTFGTGEQAPLTAVFVSKGDITKETGIVKAIAAGAAVNAGSRTSSFFSTGNRAMYVSRDGHTTIANIYGPGQPGFNSNLHVKQVRAALEAATPAGVTAYVTGRDALYEAAGGSNGGPSVVTEGLIGGAGALVILLFVFGTLPAMLMPILIAVGSILNTFTLIWALTYITSVSVIVQFLVALVGLGVAIDYSLLMIFRFREELAHGEDVETAVIETMQHAGRSVIVSGTTVAIGLLSMVILPIPVIRSIGIGGLLIPVVSVIAGITLLPALLTMMGHKINSLRVMPKAIAENQRESKAWRRWADFVVRRPAPVAAVGLIVVGLILTGAIRLNPADAQAKDLPGKGDAITGRAVLAASGLTAAAMSPFDILVERNSSQQTIDTLVQRLRATPGIAGASAPAAWRKGTSQIVEAFSTSDGATSPTDGLMGRLQHDILPAVESTAAPQTKITLGGLPAENRDFVHAVYGKFPYVLAFVILLTFVLLMRAFRSVVLPIKAVLLNLVSLGAAFGIIVYIFQDGHGSRAIWHVDPTHAIISWIPLMIFAFLYGLSMDYEVFMLTRMREAYDETHDTNAAISLGLARTGKLITSAALVLMFAFFVLSTGPGVDIKQFGIGLAAGIIFDATIIRALLVPSLMTLMGKANWWLPQPIERVLLIRRPEPSLSESS